MNIKQNSNCPSPTIRRTWTAMRRGLWLIAIALTLVTPMSATALDCPGLTEDPSLVGSYDTPSYANRSVVKGNLAYVADSNNGALLILDISDRSNPVLLGSYTPPIAGPADLEVVGTTVYLACSHRGVLVVNASDPTNPVLVGSFNAGYSFYGVEVVGNNGYFSTGSSNVFVVLNLSNPSDITIVSTLTLPSFVQDITVVGWTAYVANYESGLTIVDVSNPGIPVVIGFYNTPGLCDGVTVSGTTAYLADRASGLQIVDVSNPGAPFLLSTFPVPPSNTAEQTVIVNDRAYLSTLRQLFVLDISDQTNPILVGSHVVDNGGVALDLVINGPTACLSAGAAGLLIFDLNKEFVGQIDTPNSAKNIDRSEERRVGKECRSRWSPYH